MKRIELNIKKNVQLEKKNLQFQNIQKDLVKNRWHETILKKDKENEKKQTLKILKQQDEKQCQMLHEIRKEKLKQLYFNEEQIVKNWQFLNKVYNQLHKKLIFGIMENQLKNQMGKKISLSEKIELNKEKYIFGTLHMLGINLYQTPLLRMQYIAQTLPSLKDFGIMYKNNKKAVFSESYSSMFRGFRFLFAKNFFSQIINLHFLRKLDNKFNTQIRYSTTTNNFKNSSQNLLTIYLSYLMTQMIVYPLDVLTTKATCEIHNHKQSEVYYKKVFGSLYNTIQNEKLQGIYRGFFLNYAIQTILLSIVYFGRNFYKSEENPIQSQVIMTTVLSCLFYPFDTVLNIQIQGSFNNLSLVKKNGDIVNQLFDQPKQLVRGFPFFFIRIGSLVMLQNFMFNEKKVR